MERIEALSTYYSSRNEHERFASKPGSVEFITTLHYIEKYLRPGMKILEIGAASGRYSHYLARKGYAVDAVELTERNIELFKENTLPGEMVTIAQGDALDLKIEDKKYDITLLFGPMYHLYTEDDQRKALSEAIRVTKRGGILFVAYCSSDMTMYNYCIAKNKLGEVIEKSKINMETYRLLSNTEDVFALHRPADIDLLMMSFNVKRLHFVGTDMLVHFLKSAFDALSDDDFAFYMKFHLNICERPDMSGASNHFLDIFRKE